MKYLYVPLSCLIWGALVAPLAAQSKEAPSSIRIRGSFDFTIEFGNSPKSPSELQPSESDAEGSGELSEFFADKEALQCVIFNVESDDNDPAVIAQQIERVNGSELWLLSEVKADNAETYFDAARKNEGARFKKILGETGGSDRLMVIYNSERLRLLETRPMHDLSTNGRHRAPLAVRFRDTSNQSEFWFINNHLARGDESARNKQARGLRDFALAEFLPVVVCGDLNLDYSTLPKKEKGNEAFHTLIGEDALTWVETPRDVWTNSHPTYLSILDYYLVNPPAKDLWEMKAKVFVQEGDSRDTPSISDHRPVGLSLRLKN